MTVLAFAGARDILGTDELTVELADLGEIPPTAGALMTMLCERHDELAAFRFCVRLAVNGCYVNDDEALAAGDEVALIPPVAGG